MSAICHSLLDDGAIRVRRPSGTVVDASLPDILDALSSDEVRAFEALQAHQQQAWFSFLVQLAAMAVARENGGVIPSSPDQWKEALLGLSEGRESAWHLVVDDLSEPAFMQSPVPEGSLEAAKYKPDITTPDELDMLVTSKNHDVKMRRIVRPRIEHWIFALVTLQTMEGFLGRGNYGIVRMNRGFGNRPMVGLAGQLGWGRRFRRDLEVLLDARSATPSVGSPSGHALAWIPPWDGGKKSGLPLEACDPFFIEICRRIRFTQDDALVCWRTNTRGPRTSAPKDLNGITGDPWTPIEKAGAKALTVGESGFHYDLLRKLLLGDEYSTPPALEFRAGEDQGAYLVARTLVRGQGKTDGLHQRVVPVPPKVSRLLLSGRTDRERLAGRAKQRVALAADVQKRVLRPAVAALVASGRDDRVAWDDTRRWTDGFHRDVDARFFESLWASVDMEQDEARRDWAETLLELAERQLRDAEGSTPMASIRRWRAMSKARAIFEAGARRVRPGTSEVAATKEEEAVGGREKETGDGQ